MIIDRLERAERYLNLNKNFKKAFEFIQNNDLNSFEPGKYEIDGENAFVIIAVNKPEPEFVNKLEAHQKYIDIQIALTGSFGLKWKTIEDCKEIISVYDSEQEAAFYSDNGDFEIMLNPGTFAILFPEDAHYPQPPVEIIKKAVFKIRI